MFLAQTTQPAYWIWTNLSVAQIVAAVGAASVVFGVVGPFLYGLGVKVIRGWFGWQSEIDRLRAGMRAQSDKIQSVAQAVDEKTITTPEVAAKVNAIANTNTACDDTKMGMPAIK